MVMREVKAVIRPQRLEHVMEALHDIPGLPGIAVEKVHAYAWASSPAAAENLEADFTKFEIIVPVELVDRVVAAIAAAGHTGRPGDGVICVLPVERFVRIRDMSQDGSSEPVG